MRPALAKRFLRLSGWALEGEHPAARAYVLIAAPHTTNWDLLYFLAHAWAFGIRPSWNRQTYAVPYAVPRPARARDALARRRAGGPRAGGLVAQLAQAFQREPDLVLTVPPEGTRSRAPFWKSGFYQIARAAKLPIVMGFFDYGRRRGGLGPTLIPGDDLRSDMNAIRAFYADKRGRHPECFGDVRLAEEGRP